MIRSTFDEAVNYFDEQSIDLIHIDGLHTYEAVKHDFDTWKGRLKEGGTILFHDWNVRERNFGVWKLWDEIKSNDSYKCIEIPYGYGLGIATVSKNRPKWHIDLINYLPVLQMKGTILNRANHHRMMHKQKQDENNKLRKEIVNLQENNKKLMQHTIELEKIINYLKVPRIRRLISKIKRLVSKKSIIS